MSGGGSRGELEGEEEEGGGRVGGAKRGNGDPDGLPVPNMLLLGFKAPGQARHSPSTSLMRARTRKAASEAF